MTDNRERVGSILKTNGEKYDVYVLKLRDIIGVDASTQEGIFRLGAKSIQIPYEEFIEWDLQDAMKVIDLVGKSLRVLGAL